MNIEALEQLIRYEHKTNKGNLSHFRYTFEPYIYNVLLLRYGAILETFWKTYQPTKSDKAFVIVERRCHPNFWFVLRNIAWANPGMSVYIFCSDVNIDFLRALIGDKNIHLIQVFTGSPSREEAIKEYNAFLTSPTMYQAIDAEWIITVQMDVFIRRKIPDSIFMGEYWGYPFGWNQTYAGGGGATVRNVKKCYELCINNTNIDTTEDVWFCERVTDIPLYDIRNHYIIENTISYNPYIVHQFWTFIDQLIDECPHIELKDYLNHLLTFELS